METDPAVTGRFSLSLPVETPAECAQCAWIEEHEPDCDIRAAHQCTCGYFKRGGRLSPSIAAACSPSKTSACPASETVDDPLSPQVYVISEPHLSGARVIVGFNSLEEAREAHAWISRRAHKR